MTYINKTRKCLLRFFATVVGLALVGLIGIPKVFNKESESPKTLTKNEIAFSPHKALADLPHNPPVGDSSGK